MNSISVKGDGMDVAVNVTHERCKDKVYFSKFGKRLGLCTA